MRRSVHAPAWLVVGVVAFLVPFVLLGGAPARAEDAPEPPRPLGRDTGTTTFEHWEFWYHHNADRLEALTAGTRRVEPTGPAAAAHARILDTLRGLLDQGDGALHQAIRAEACRALGRTTSSKADAGRLIGVLQSEHENLLVREGAAVGLGLLRRDDAARVLPPESYVRARDALLETMEDATCPSRMRGFATLALGLLADQPYGEGDAARSMVVGRLLAQLRSRGVHGLKAAALHALCLFEPDDIDDETRTVLRDALVKGRIERDAASDIERAQAALALGALGTEEDVAVLLRVVGMRRGAGQNARRSAAIALGRLGARLPYEDRSRLVGKVLSPLERRTVKDASTIGFLRMALVELATGGEPAEGARLLKQTRLGNAMLKTAEKGRYLERPYAVLGLGLVLRSLGDDEAAKPFRAKALALLRKGLQKPTDVPVRAAIVLALGLARDETMVPVLRTMAMDDRRDGVIRGFALLASAYAAPDGATHRLARAQLETRPRGFHALAATRVLGMTGKHADASSVGVLGAAVRGELRSAPAGEAAVALGRIGTVEAAKPLLAVAPDDHQQDLHRAMATAGLGRIADPSQVSALAFLTAHQNHRAMTDLQNELFRLF